MDARATNETLRQHGRFVHELARALLRDPAAAEDVAQEAWVQWWRRAEAPSNPRGWLARVVRSLASNQRRAGERRARREAEGARPEGERAPDEEVAESELLHRVVDAVYALEEPYRETILARYFRGEEAPALARASGTPLATLRSRERRALEMLRAKLDRESGGRAAWALALARLVPLEPAGALLLPWLAAAFLVAAGALGWRWLRPAEPATATVARELGAPSVPAPEPEPGLSSASAPGDERAALAPSPAPDARIFVGAAAGRTDPSTLVGTTQDPEGRTLAGVRLRFLRAGQAVGSGTSDGQGRFELAVGSFDEVEAELDGYRFLHATDPEPDPMHAFEPMWVTLVPDGEVAVDVHDVEGEPLQNVSVSVHPRAEELADTSANQPSLGSQRAPIEAKTDRAGRAVLANVWSGVRLVLELDLEGGTDTGELSVERQREGRLVLDGGAGAPIVLAGRRLELTARWGALHHLEGVVLDAKGAPVAHASVEVSDDGFAGNERGHGLAYTRTRNGGRFEAAFRPPVLRGAVRVLATVAGGPHLVGKDDAGGPGATLHFPELQAERRLTPEELAAPEPLVLTLAPNGESLLSGVLLDPRGAACDAAAHRLILLRGGVALPTLESIYTRSSGGGFVFFALAPGPCELLVASSDPLERSRTLGEPAFSRFAGLAVGSEGLELVLPDAAPVRIRLRGEALQSLSLAHLLLAQPGTLSPPRAERTLVLREPAFWLDNDMRLERPEGTWLVAETKARGAREAELALGEPGAYRIGVTSAAPLAPVASELLWFEAGDYELDVQPPPATGILRGRLVADGTREFYGLVLADEHGQPFPTAAPTPRERLDVHPLKTSGEFLLRELAIGRYRLRFGSTDELAAGRFAREVPLEIVPGENALEVRL
jgi:RNA polymerase sigma-70 factor, ECF subfamily